MLTIDIKTNLSQITKRLNTLAKTQVPFATASALTSLAKIVQESEVENEKKVIDRPTSFTLKAVRIVPARKQAPVARIVMQDITAKYLEPYQFGGKNKLNSRALLLPIEAVKNLDQYGNLPRNFLARLKGRSDIFIGPVKTKTGVVNGVWQRAKGEFGTSPVLQTRVTKKGKVIVTKKQAYVPSREGRRLKLIIEFKDAHAVVKRLDWFGVADRAIAKHFNREFGKALAKALATAN